MAKKNTGKRYEKFVQEVFEEINKLEGLTNVKVEASKDFEGNTLDEDGEPIPHEIDVHWTFELDGQTFTTVIQARDWGTQAKKEHMIAFDGIVRDIGPPTTRGIFVARSGFQKGAISWAKAKNLKAAELRKTHPAERKNRVETIKWTLEIAAPHIVVTSINIDAWLASLTPIQRNSLDGVQIGFDPNHTKMFSASALELGTFTDVIVCEPTVCGNESHQHKQTFDPPLYFDFANGLPRAKLDSLTADITIHREKREHIIHKPLTHILRSVTGDESYFVSVEANGALFVKRVDDLSPPPKPRPKSSW